ncbi:hypothetical protein ABB37_02815 [Leptomonas pyrrhocoris]|uniref:Uncharacterized protein n=1 Tax=Leptomonas pyrrhocoris TaxID=157538 RepID=A0A0M9G696_LEPPY|nr:hypothetical protein ABB37_02815 [Leptomonas pyrrhocoris]KPA83109.1 hypothetical protein ABB37_02815 [Leptomonas pyrrhocoris]|eukprot:XP_015661548.1 hypothetical protein ABB37_02815 [Leptomonas pyrrhocoris]
MPTRAGTEARRSISSSLLESHLLQAPHKPELLYKVVGWIWSSLVYAAVPDGAADLGDGHVPASFVTELSHAGGETDCAKLAPATAPASAGVQLEAQALPLEPSSFGTFAASPPRLSGVAPSTHDGLATPYAEETLVGQVFSSGAMVSSDGEEMGSHSLGNTNAFDATLTATAATGHSIITASTAPSSTEESPLSVSTQYAPLVQLSPLVLRLLLWWAGRPLLPSLHGDPPGVGDAAGSARGLMKDSNDSSGGEYVLTQQRCQRDAEEVHRLRLRMAEIFGLLCRRGFGVVVSDALVYGGCHDASEAAAGRCKFVFGSCPDAAWRTATSTAAVKLRNRAESTGSGLAEFPLDLLAPSVGRGDAATENGGVPPRYDLDRLLCALVRLHTPHNDTAACEADVTAAGQLLRSLLRCPRLHTRIVRLFDSDRPPTKHAKPVFGNVLSTTLLSSLNISPHSRASRQTGRPPAGANEEEEEEAAASSLRLQSFLPALTHPSPVISSEAWHTIGVLLFPSASLTTATRQLLQRTPECPVQRLLVAALALPGEEPTTPQSMSAPLPPPLPWTQSSHPMARNSALRVLHVLCVSKDVSPASQLLITQCPALLWRVLKLAAELCQGNPVANMALVRQVLADYVMSAMLPSTTRHATTASSGVTPVQLLLRRNGDALSRLFASTNAQWGARGGVALLPDDSGGDYAEATTTAEYDEADLQRAVQTLQM